MIRVGWRNLFIKICQELKEKNITLDNIYAKPKLGTMRIEGKCSRIRNWSEIYPQLVIYFQDILVKYI